MNTILSAARILALTCLILVVPFMTSPILTTHATEQVVSPTPFANPTDEDGPAGITSNPSDDTDQDGPAGITSNPSDDTDQDGPSGITSNPGSEEDQDAFTPPPVASTTESKSEAEPTPEAAPSSVSRSSGSSGKRSSATFITPPTTGRVDGGQVLGASTSCGIYLNTPLNYGSKNDVAHMLKLQAFLNEAAGEELTINGIFDRATLAAVKRFQIAHKSIIIDPWIKNGKNPRGIASGYVGTTTLWMINDLACPSLKIPLPMIY